MDDDTRAGHPARAAPDISTGRVAVPPNTFVRSPNPTDVDRATIQQAHAAVEQRLPGHLSFEVAYVYTRTDGGYAARNVNHSEPGAGQAGRKLYALARTADIGDWAARTRSRYHGLQVALNRPFRNGLLLKGAYTLSRAQNETDEDGWIALAWAHPAVLDRNFALATYDRPHVFQLGFAWELPFARGSKSLLGRLVQGRQLSGLVSAYSGAPFSITALNPQLNCPGCGPITIDVVGEPEPTGTAGSSTGTWYDRALFSQPTGATLAGFGNSARNQFRSPGVWNVDLSVIRSVRIGRLRPEIRVEAANPRAPGDPARPAPGVFRPAAGPQRKGAATGEAQRLARSSSVIATSAASAGPSRDRTSRSFSCTASEKPSRRPSLSFLAQPASCRAMSGAGAPVHPRRAASRESPGGAAGPPASAYGSRLAERVECTCVDWSTYSTRCER